MELDVVAKGRDAWERLKSRRNINDWWAVAEALKAVQDEATIRAGTSKGGRHSKIMGDLLHENGLGDIDKGDRWRAIEMLKHRRDIEIWLETLPLNRRLRLNHPRSILRRWEKSTVFSSQKRKNGPTTLEKTEQELFDALERIDRLESGEEIKDLYDRVEHLESSWSDDT